jgi:hypothetical protein
MVAMLTLVTTDPEDQRPILRSIPITATSSAKNVIGIYPETLLTTASDLFLASALKRWKKLSKITLPGITQ